jgi:hypothetical protein
MSFVVDILAPFGLARVLATFQKYWVIFLPICSSLGIQVHSFKQKANKAKVLVSDELLQSMQVFSPLKWPHGVLLLE